MKTSIKPLLMFCRLRFHNNFNISFKIEMASLSRIYSRWWPVPIE